MPIDVGDRVQAMDAILWCLGYRKGVVLAKAADELEILFDDADVFGERRRWVNKALLEVEAQP